MRTYLWIALGGGLGSVLRVGLQNLLQRATGSAFPVGTLVVNLLGCFLIGLFIAAFKGSWPLREEYRLGLTAGVLGGFTTFSTFGLETQTLLQERQYASAAVYVIASCGVGILAVWCGDRLGSWWGT